jgi:hypothetical protein
MRLDPVLLRGREVWERVVEGWVDNIPDDAFTHTVEIREPGLALALSLVALPPPSYEIRQAQARVLDGTVAPGVLAGVGALGGVRMVGGLSRRLAEAFGSGEGTALARDAVIEVARLARQVTKLPRARADAAAGDPAACWELDTAGWTELADSCFTYSAAGRALFATRAVTTPMTPDLYSPRPGQERVFVRRKVARLERVGGRLRLSHSMHDNVHGFELGFDLDAETGRIVRAEGVTPRLPYHGICSEPQRRLGALVGETADAGLAKRIQTALGGSAGCAQLYDLTADLLKLLAR